MSEEFEFTDEHLELRTMVRDFCQDVSPESVVRETMESDSGVDRELWKRIGSDLGIIGVAAPEQYGGGGVGIVFQAIVQEQLGAGLVCGPVIGTICLAIPLLTAIDDQTAKQDLLPDLIAGERIATVAAPLANGDLDPDMITITANENDGIWELNGTVRYVPDAPTADLLLVPAHTTNGVALFAVNTTSPGITITAPLTMDLTRRQGNITLETTQGRLIANPTTTTHAYQQMLQSANTLLAAEQVGIAQRMLDITVQYVSDRLQFGQPIGAFQAVKHRCANMLIAVEQARTAAYHAAWTIQDQLDNPQLATSLAQATTTESANWVTASAIQLHGGIGFTWEGTPHLYYKRATTNSLTLGNTEHHTNQIANTILNPTTT